MTLLKHLTTIAKLARAAVDTTRPMMVNLIVTRRCNLACGYCVEYDKTSPPVPFETLTQRIDQLAALGTTIITLTGGETLLHPQIVEIVRYIRDRGMVAALNTNAFLLTEAHIAGFNAAGLTAMQISVDGVEPNEVTKKALRLLLPKFALLKAHATFRVRINTVLGSGPPQEALVVARAAIAHGFDAKCALLRRPDGEPADLSPAAKAVYFELKALEGRSLGLLQEGFNDTLLADGEVDWKCRAGARFFHVCENGLVHYCTPRTGSPGKPLALYTKADIAHHFDLAKHCTARCPVAYAHQASMVDSWRAQDNQEPKRVRLPMAA